MRPQVIFRKRLAPPGTPQACPLHLMLGAVCVVSLWLGTRHLKVGLRRLGAITVHAALGFVLWVAVVVAAFWSGFLPFII